ncbi:SixA phosphatase family protein [Aquipuribacter nitratireducens]|uniref:SixA phosphatase family protein n=1 Tax=Aquipuribacter nitratireducens TaxID=650104 RepID=A0ABW0GIF6_9MICO
MSDAAGGIAATAAGESRTRRGSRRLLVVRHAKAAYPDGVVDHDRPLTERGERDAAAVGRWMATERFVPDVVLTSDAVRALGTWELVAPELGVEPEVHVERRLYNADADTVLDLVRTHGGDAHTVAVFGHEPGLSTLARTLADPETSDPQELAGLSDRFPTAGVVVMRTRSAWVDTPLGGLVLARVVVPRS